jgi:glycosyltransferase involved in cell wall biosynthesis
VRVFHKENGGVTAARADGVKNSHGEWITFVDADDYLFSDSLKILYNNINCDIDIIIGSIENKYNKLCHEDTIISHDEYQKSLIIYNNGNWSLCGKFYRKELFIDKIFDIHHQCIYGEDIRFPEA